MSENATPASERELPPLRIWHLMLWTAVTAVLMTIGQRLAGAENKWYAASIICWAIAGAMAVCIICLGCYWQRRGLTFFTQPAHGVAIIVVLSMLEWFLMIGIASLASLLLDREISDQYYTLPALALNLVIIGAACRLLRSLADTGPWRWFFLFGIWRASVSAVQFALHTLMVMMFDNYGYRIAYDAYYFLEKAGMTLEGFAYVLLLWAIVVDRRRMISRHWTHWGMTWVVLLAGMIGAVSTLFTYDLK